ncbi:MAG: 1-acyl-sn-glycerol-3-phosphate acyltransferase [Myxococcota bacterium]|nr:1-acyl-sn-glycerol-3-phosphate acyltransferase [Myxococcota bacterium]
MIALVQTILAVLIRAITGVRRIDPRAVPEGPAVFFANHSSHLDTLVIWAALPSAHRARLRPVAAADYWLRSRLRRFIAERVLNALMIARQRSERSSDPVDDMAGALGSGALLLIFPEGTRGRGAGVERFRGGLHALASRRPDATFVPIYLENLSRVLPKGEAIPLPLIVRVCVGEPLVERPSALPREAWLEAARAAVIALGPETIREELHHA